ncbi:MAG: UDP-N-acetylmuramoyl-L-alanine--D-glutamate ligase [Clostridia bacterium]
MLYKNEKLEEFNRFIEGKKIAIIGMGVSNIPLLDYFYEHHVKVTVFDNRELEQIDENAIQKINQYQMLYYFGKDNLKHLQNFDMLFRSPSAMPFIPEIEAEVERGAILTSEIEMVMKLTPSKVIGITGTEGKTTTTTIISEIMKKAGYRYFLGGNIGTPLFTQIKDMRPEDFVILEMSSFQLMNMEESPDIAIITNIFPDHLNIHRSYEEYREAKTNIFKQQSSTGIIVLNYDNEYTRAFAKQAPGKVIFFSSKEKLEDGYIYDAQDEKIKYCKDGVRRHILDRKDIKLRGIHNYENICAAIAATSSIVDTQTQIEAIKAFKGVEHRLEFVREIEGVKWYNDSIGTSPASTISGLKAFEENIILLAGGSDKGLDYTQVGEAIAERVGILILMGVTAPKIEEATQKALLKTGKTMPIYHCNTFEEAVNLAKEKAQKGDIVLLSPASASFDMFKNFAQRGDYFKQLVNEL